MHRPLAAVLAAGLTVLSLAVAPRASLLAQEPEPQIAPTLSGLASSQPSPFGFVPPPVDLSHLRPRIRSLTQSAPSSFDWRQLGKVTPVKNQKACGSCYAFASIGNFESKVLIDEDVAYDFSENNVKECEWWDSSCNGGNYWRVASFLATNGTVLETCDPYVAADVECNSTCPYVATLLDWCVLSSSQPAPVDVIKSYLQTYGPLYTAMYAGYYDDWYYEFQSYDGSYTLYYDGVETPNHAVLIVGWDDTLPHEGGQGAWIVKNSWGTNWGGTCGYGTERGYFTIAYGSARIGSYISFLNDWQSYDANGEVLYYDEAGYTSAVGYSNPTAWGLCKFTPSYDIDLLRVEVWTLDEATVDVYVYDDFSGGVPSDLLGQSLGNHFSLPGYHSIQLPSPLPIDAGNDIYVAVKVTDATYAYPLAFDSEGPPESGCSYISSNGSYFSSFSAGDLGIRIRVGRRIGCGPLYESPVILTVTDVPEDEGGFVQLTWTRSTHDYFGSTPQVRRYRIWRKRKALLQGMLGGSGFEATFEGPFEVDESGSVWELVGTVSATGACDYQFVAPTLCDSTDSDTCWTYFRVTAHTGTVGEHYDSEIARGYSVDNNPEPSSDGKEDTEEDLPVISGLSINPNPSRSNLALDFKIESTAQVQVNLYDVTGRLLATLVDDYLPAGTYHVSLDNIDGVSLAPGIYFVHILTPGESITRKVTLLR